MVAGHWPPQREERHGTIATAPPPRLLKIKRGLTSSAEIGHVS
jgi:hypothetical protein